MRHPILQERGKLKLTHPEYTRANLSMAAPTALGQHWKDLASLQGRTGRKPRIQEPK